MCSQTWVVVLCDQGNWILVDGRIVERKEERRVVVRERRFRERRRGWRGLLRRLAGSIVMGGD